MWDSISHRNGMQKCCLVGYNLHSIGVFLGLVAFLLFLVITSYLVYTLLSGGFHWSLCWLFAAPVALAITAQALSMFGWHLAGKKQFDYNYDKREASWFENGKRVTFKA